MNVLAVIYGLTVVCFALVAITAGSVYLSALALIASLVAFIGIVAVLA